MIREFQRLMPDPGGADNLLASGAASCCIFLSPCAKQGVQRQSGSSQASCECAVTSLADQACFTCGGPVITSPTSAFSRGRVWGTSQRCHFAPAYLRAACSCLAASIRAYIECQVPNTHACGIVQSTLPTDNDLYGGDGGRDSWGYSGGGAAADPRMQDAYNDLLTGSDLFSERYFAQALKSQIE